MHELSDAAAHHQPVAPYLKHPYMQTYIHTSHSAPPASYMPLLKHTHASGVRAGEGAACAAAAGGRRRGEAGAASQWRRCVAGCVVSGVLGGLRARVATCLPW